LRNSLALVIYPPEKQGHILRQWVKQNADNMLLGAALARHMIWESFYLPLSQQHIAYGPYGKPYLQDYPNAHFNISHSVVDRPVGIDVQVIGAYRPMLLSGVCSEEELATIGASDDPIAEFTKLWTQKEAYLRMMGCGITGGIRELSAREKKQIKTSLLPDAGLSVAYS